MRPKVPEFARQDSLPKMAAAEPPGRLDGSSEWSEAGEAQLYRRRPLHFLRAQPRSIWR